MLSRYPLPRDQWRTAPLESSLPDDDEFYTVVSLHPSQDVQVAEVDGCIVRPVYEGKVDIHGNPDNSMFLEGGLKDGKVFGVETVVRGITALNELVIDVSGGDNQIVVVEVLRTGIRQRNGHKKTWLQMLDADHIKVPDPGQVLQYGRKAKSIFSYVPADPTTAAYGVLLDGLRKNDKLIQALRDASELASDQPVDGVLKEYINIAGSLGYGDVANAGLEFPASRIVHGGSAFDIFIADRQGKIISLRPFDYPDEEVAAYRFGENPANYERLLKEIASKPRLAEHYRLMGYPTPESFTRNDYDRFQQAQRLLVRCVVAMNGTTYMFEGWHFELGTVWFNLLKNTMYLDSLAAQFPFSGGTGYTSIRQGAKGTAVWHTANTTAALRKRKLLAA